MTDRPSGPPEEAEEALIAAAAAAPTAATMAAAPGATPPGAAVPGASPPGASPPGAALPGGALLGRARLSAAVGIGEATPAAIRQKVIQLAGPAIAEMTFSSMIQVLNMVLVGHLGPVAVAAVGLTNQPVFFAISAFQALNVGATALVARAVGAGHPEEANEVTRQTLLINVVLSAVMAALGYIFAAQILAFMGAEDEVISAGLSYFQVIAMTLSFNTLSMSLNSALRGAGDTKTPMRVSLIANVLAVILGYPLIYGAFGLPALGVLGAAVASAMARFAAFALSLSAVVSGKYVIKVGLRDRWRWNGAIIARMVRIGLPAALEQFVMRGGMVIFTRTVAGLGTVTVAAHQIAMNVLSLSFMPSQGFAVAATTLVGQNLGAKRPDWAERCGWETRRLGLIMGVSLGALFFLGAPWIVRMYTSDAGVIAFGAVALRIAALAQPAQVNQFVLAGGLRGAGDTTWPLYAAFAGVWGFRVTLCLLFVNVLHWGLAGAWLAMLVDQLTRSLVIYMRWKSGRWKTAKV